MSATFTRGYGHFDYKPDPYDNPILRWAKECAAHDPAAEWMLEAAKPGSIATDLAGFAERVRAIALERVLPWMERRGYPRDRMMDLIEYDDTERMAWLDKVRPPPPPEDES